MAVYFANTEITGIKDLFPLSSKDITGLYFADTKLFTVWDEYDGALPATYSANGSTLADYRIYGAAGGVGDHSGTAYGYKVDMSVQSENLFDPSDAVPDYRYDDNGNWIKDVGVLSSGYMKVTAEDRYEYKFATVTGKTNGICRINFLDASGQWLSVKKVPFNTLSKVTISGTVPAGAALIRTSQYNGELDISMTVVADTTPIYIGDTTLGEDEYVDYGEQKVYRRTDNLWDVPLVQGAWRAADGVWLAGNAGYVSNTSKISVDAETTYSFDFASATIAPINRLYAYFWDSSNTYLGYQDILSNRVFNTPSNTAFLAVSIGTTTTSGVVPQDISNVMLVEGSTVPSTYIPYLQPEDPPVPLPTLPTVDGINVVDYAGQSAAVPSRFYAKYRKEGFE